MGFAGVGMFGEGNMDDFRRRALDLDGEEKEDGKNFNLRITFRVVAEVISSCQKSSEGSASLRTKSCQTIKQTNLHFGWLFATLSETKASGHVECASGPHWAIGPHFGAPIEMFKKNCALDFTGQWPVTA